MREIKWIIVHCSGGNQRATAAEVKAYHLRPESQGGRGWKAPGYHYFVEADGNVVEMWPEERIANGCYGKNGNGIQVCYAGGVDCSSRDLKPVDNRTPAQRLALEQLLRRLKQKYPKAKIHSHRDFAPKACPSFDATGEYRNL